VPNIYSYIQTKYWSVGFLNYYTSTNFLFILIGIPSLLLSFSGFFKVFQKLNLKYKTTLYKINFVGIYLSFLILWGVSTFLANVQSSTRFLCSHPMFYIFLATLVKNKLIKVWIISYNIVGSILFCLGFPWT